MTQSCPVFEQKSTPKKQHSREKQVKCLKKTAEDPLKSQTSVARENGVPRSTLQFWQSRKCAMLERSSLAQEVVSLFETPCGLVFLHRLAGAAFYVFHKIGDAGIPLFQQFLEKSHLEEILGASDGYLNKLSQHVDTKIIYFGEEQNKLLGALMPLRRITMALDETFFRNIMILVAMEPASGFILTEEIQEKRDAKTWESTIKKSLEGLNVVVIQSVGDQAGGITKLAKDILGIHHSADLFHVQQDITKALSLNIARAVKQATASLQENQEKQKRKLERFDAALGEKQLKASTELSQKVIQLGNELIDIDKKILEANFQKESAEADQKQLREEKKSLGDIYHPVDFETGKLKGPECVEKELRTKFKNLEDIADKHTLSDRQKKLLSKAKGMVDELTATLTFFYLLFFELCKGWELTSKERLILKRNLVSYEYLLLAAARQSDRKKKERYLELAKQLLDELNNKNCFWKDLSEKEKKRIHEYAKTVAEIFQRSSSCVEGRNGRLSLLHHSFHRLSSRKLKCLTVIHNYGIIDDEGKTAAEQFFKQKHEDLFEWLLNNIAFPVRGRKQKWRKIEGKAAA